MVYQCPADPIASPTPTLDFGPAVQCILIMPFSCASPDP